MRRICNEWLMRLMISLVVVCAFRFVTAEKKTLVLFGITGCGKSTIANCLLKQSADITSIEHGGFNVTDSASSGTHKFEMLSNERFNIIDTIGFGSMEFNASFILGEMRSVLAAVDNKVDHILFVIEKGHIHNETYELIRHFQQDVLRNKSEHNSALIVNKCIPPGWLDKPEQRDNHWLQLILQSVGHSAHEFELKMDDPRDDDTDKARNRVYRQESIDALVTFLEKRENQHAPINLDFIQSGEFETSWLAYIYNYLSYLASFLIKNKTSGKSSNHNEKKPG